jgi:hypothetical protein
MRGLELVVVLGVAVLLCSLLARRFGVTPPVLLFGCGVLLGFIPALRRAHLPPEAMLFLFLPALLYWHRLRLEYEEQLHVLHTNGEDANDEPARRHDQQYTALRLALLTRKRATVVRLRDDRRIDDIVLRQIQARLDIEEVRLTRGQAID